MNKPELSLKFFLGKLVSEMFGVEGRLPKTLKVLLFKPGELTKNYFREKSTDYIPPTTLYFTINLIFFLLLPFINNENVKFLSFSYSGFLMGNGFYAEQLQADQSASNLPVDEYRALFDSHITYNQPALIFTVIPFFALLLMLLEIRQKRYYLEHLVTSFHFMSFFLIVFFLTAAFFSLAFWIMHIEQPNVSLAVIFQIYFFYSLAAFLFISFRFYEDITSIKFLRVFGKHYYYSLGLYLF
ncbi:DUF3667 domain-containing protein [candidate division KSB1 bacterium]|nr:DUF3667 domain-containing protein [candidate division KSB1 bacterium]